MKEKKILVWFRNDLRLHDNEMLVEAIAKSDSILPVYFFDPAHFEYNAEGKIKEGNSRVQFLIESVSALRESLKKIGGNLLVVNGSPEEHMPALVEQYEIAEVYHHREVATKETTVSSNVEDLLWKLKVNLKHFIGHTLYNKEDLPFPIKDIPDIFAQFKKKTERDAIVKACFLSPEVISLVEVDSWGELPDYEAVSTGPLGGEESGIAHLNDLFSEGAEIYARINSRTNADKHVYSSKLSPWLALGCLSPRKVYWAVKDAERKFGTNGNFSHLILGLLWRDYFRFMFKKHTLHYFTDIVTDIESPSDAGQSEINLQAWKDGNTGHGLVDKYMNDLNVSGFIPHAGRLIVATFLIYVLKLNWLDGASYFEQKLIDYSPASNWGNWANVAMGGKDPRSKNTFDLDKQIKMLDLEIYAPS
ncbi:deoxyribodipyrimidine photo-lyase [Pedobacter westerhofensis]|uniref:Cryptochrome DASH n=1 Tax=Pedobacter westerhofensis TaxID=425512 RepID=A0A521BZ83_9SPHI|nr:DASH family cryptochrome [Pedobacter westerhofensis]SMO52458.1 deoxyribodipyrimidine photo-lyase [Pedobacter westerhofensis]